MKISVADSANVQKFVERLASVGAFNPEGAARIVNEHIEVLSSLIGLSIVGVWLHDDEDVTIELSNGESIQFCGGLDPLYYAIHDTNGGE